MSTNRLQDDLFDCLEINAGIVERQRAAIAALEALDELQRNYEIPQTDLEDKINHVIDILKGRA